MQKSMETPPTQLFRERFRRGLSNFVNAQLGRFGYAIVRTNGGTRPMETSLTEEPRDPYDNLCLLDVYSPWMNDRIFLQIWQEASPYTLTDIFRAYEIYQCVREVAAIPGDVLEVGVWRGGTGAVLAAAAKRWKPTAKVWLCDTFYGVVKAGNFDTAYSGGEHADTSPETVASLLAGMSLTNASILNGVFPDDTAADIPSSNIALCHIDVDVYQSAADIVTWLAPRMTRGGIVVFDDYGFSTCKGITRFVDELRATGEWIYIYNLNKHALMIKR